MYGKTVPRYVSEFAIEKAAVNAEGAVVNRGKRPGMTIWYSVLAARATEGVMTRVSTVAAMVPTQVAVPSSMKSMLLIIWRMIAVNVPAKFAWPAANVTVMVSATGVTTMALGKIMLRIRLEGVLTSLLVMKGKTSTLPGVMGVNAVFEKVVDAAR
jgi:hypothetical protein